MPVDSLCWVRPLDVGRGDFLVIEGDRLVLLLASTRVGASTGLGTSNCLAVSFSKSLGAGHANLIVHRRFGASVAGRAAGDCGAIGVGCTTLAGLVLPPHANVIQRFLGTTSAGGCALGEMLSTSDRWDIESFISTGAAGPIGECTVPKEYGPKFVYASLGGGGLGVFVRAGLVNPPSLVSSAVEARLALLIMDRRRVRSVLTRMGASWFELIMSGLLRALVKRDSLRGASKWIAALWKSDCVISFCGSGGSSTSAARSSSPTAGVLAVVCTVFSLQLKRS